jgi:hypothetical protein
VTYKASSLIIVPNALLRLKVKLEIKAIKIEAFKISLIKEDETTNVFALTFIKLEENLS